jgi:hypothetical protein
MLRCTARRIEDQGQSSARDQAETYTLGVRSNAEAGLSGNPASTLKLGIRVHDRLLTATLVDSETTRDFISLLPLSLTMNDLFGQEKFAHLPRAISGRTVRTHAREVGDVTYWAPGSELGICYRDGGRSINAAVIVLGKIHDDLERLDVPGCLDLVIDLIT